MGGSYNEDERRRDSKKGSLMETSITQDQWEDQELDGRMCFREDKRMEEKSCK
jgi:hypothetical protein